MARFQPKKSLPLLVPSQNEWQITHLVPGGVGFVRLESGQGAFAAGALPGERIRVEAAEDHRSYLNATRWTLLTPSPDRVTPACPVQARCGGCDLMVLSYPAQLAAKQHMLREALTRTGQFAELPELRFVPSEQELGYRSRIRLHVDGAGRLGFYAENSQTLVEIDGCNVADPELDRGLVTLREIAARFPRSFAAFAELELRVAPAGPRLSLWLAPRAKKIAGSADFWGALRAAFHVAVGTEPPNPEFDQRFDLPNQVELRAPAHAFTQVNWPINRAIVRAVLDGAERRGARTFLDLYCGAGNFSLPLLARGLSGVGVESAPVSIAAAERAARAANLHGARFVAGDVREALAQLSPSEHFDLVVLDPPRAGAREIVDQLARRAAPQIAYCACDPVTLARDLRALCDSGYELEEVTGYDMFPQTHHFETLVWLRRNAR